LIATISRVSKYMSEILLSHEKLHQAFELLAEQCAKRGVVGEVHVFGGAAMVLAFHSRLATRDVDAIFAPDTEVLEAAWVVAKKLGLPKSWLNNQASSYMSGKAGRGTPVFDRPSLRVSVTPPEHLLAMKVRAARALRDADDIEVLLGHLKISKYSEVVKIVTRHFPYDPLSEKSAVLLKEIMKKG
jgi:hypothetical protein